MKHTKSTKKFFRDILEADRPYIKTGEVELTKEASMGNKIARHELIARNIKMVFKMAEPYVNNNVQMSDLLEEGCHGIFDALDVYDNTKKVKFLTFAKFYILRRLAEYSRMMCCIANIPTTAYYRRKTIWHCMNNENTTLPEQISNKTGISVDLVSSEQKVLATTYSINEVNQADKEYIEAIPNETEEETNYNGHEEVFMIELLKKALEQLNPRERYLIKAKYGIDNTQKKNARELGEEMDINRSTIVFFQQRAQENIKKYIMSHSAE